MKRLKVSWRDHVINMSLPESGVLSAIVSVLDRKDREPDTEDAVLLQLGGLDSIDGLHPHWGDYDLAPGDEITISVFDDRATDPPIERRGLTKEGDEAYKKQYLRQTAEEFGWELIEHVSKGEQGGGGNGGEIGK